jgi:Fe2+ transport system protein B
MVSYFRLAGNPNVAKVLYSQFERKNSIGKLAGQDGCKLQGRYKHKNRFFIGGFSVTYYLMSNSVEEEVAGTLYVSKTDATVIVTDATCLGGNLILVLQIWK